MGELHVRKRLRNVDPVSLRAGASISIGRSSSNVVVLPSNAVSRKHCIIEVAEGRPRLRDLGSRAGTHVNGEKVSEAWLTHGDVIVIGRFELVYEDPAASAPASAVGAVTDGANPPPSPDFAAERAELDALRVDLEIRRAEIEATKGELAARAAALAAGPPPSPVDEAAVAARLDAVAAREQAAATLESTLEAARRELDDQRAALAADAEARLESQEEMLAAREDELAAERSTLAESQRQLETQRQEWETRQHDLETRQAAAATALQAREDALEQRERALAAERETLEARTRAIEAEAAELGSRLAAAETTRTKSEECAVAAERGKEELQPVVETLRAKQETLEAELAASRTHAASQGDSIRRLDAERKALLEERSQLAMAIAELRAAIGAVVQAAQCLHASRHRVRVLEARWIDTDEAMNAVDAAGVAPDDDLLERHATLATDLEEAHEEREQATNALEATLGTLARTAGPIEPPGPWRGLPADAGADAKGRFGWLKRGRG